MALAFGDDEARDIVAGLLRDAGCVPVDLGRLVFGRAVQSDRPLYAKTPSEPEMRAALAPSTGA